MLLVCATTALAAKRVCRHACDYVQRHCGAESRTPVRCTRALRRLRQCDLSGTPCSSTTSTSLTVTTTSSSTGPATTATTLFTRGPTTTTNNSTTTAPAITTTTVTIPANSHWSTTTTLLDGPGCGNHVIEDGEECDGEPWCAWNCRLTLSSACCEFTAPSGALCSASTFNYVYNAVLASSCGGYGRAERGTVRASNDACEVGVGLFAGGCEPAPALPAPVRWCCQTSYFYSGGPGSHPPSCSGGESTDVFELSNADWGCRYQAPEGQQFIRWNQTCSEDGLCVAAE